MTAETAFVLSAAASPGGPAAMLPAAAAAGPGGAGRAAGLLPRLSRAALGRAGLRRAAPCAPAPLHLHAEPGGGRGGSRARQGFPRRTWHHAGPRQSRAGRCPAPGPRSAPRHRPAPPPRARSRARARSVSAPPGSRLRRLGRGASGQRRQRPASRWSPLPFGKDGPEGGR